MLSDLEPQLQRSARSRGAAAGRAARRQAPGEADGEVVVRELAGQGYQPYRDGADTRLRNCPFHVLADRYPPLICGMNLALVEGLLAGAAAATLEARLDPRPGDCCVALREAVPPSKTNLY